MSFKLIYTLVVAVIATPGFMKLAEKCGDKKYYGFIPFYRVYRLARMADSEDAGIMWFISYVLPLFADYLIGLFGEDNTIGAWFVLVVVAICNIVCLFYEIKIYLALCRLFGRRKLWIVPWLWAYFIPALIWGFSKKILPKLEEEENLNAAPESGVELEDSMEGLTVNLNARKANNGLKSCTLLKDIHLKIDSGKMVLLLGGSGAGKTTFINALIGYEPADAKILLNGSDVYKEYDKMKYEIGMVPQMDLMRYEDSVYMTLMDAAALRLPENVSTKERRKRVEEVLDIFGLTTVRSRQVGKLSGGQKKRLSIAMEFICDPKLFVLDEPDSGLDGTLARELMERLHKISREGKIVIVITHTPDRVIDLFDEVIVLAKDANRTGRLVFHGPIETARKFFDTDMMEKVIKKINRVDEGGEGKADELIEKFGGGCYEQ